MKLATNRAMPYHWLTSAGANVCLGTDGCASNNNLDMFEEMKTAALLQKFFWNDPTVLPAPEALAMGGYKRCKGTPHWYRNADDRSTRRYYPHQYPDRL